MARFALEITASGKPQKAECQPARSPSSAFHFNSGSRLVEHMIHSIETRPPTTSRHLLVVLRCLPQCRHHLLLETARLRSAPADALPLGVVDVPKVVQRPCLTHLTQTGASTSVMSVSLGAWHQINSASAHLVTEVSAYVQVPLAANHGLVEATQHLQRVAQVPAGFGFSEQVADGPAQHASRERKRERHCARCVA